VFIGAANPASLYYADFVDDVSSSYRERTIYVNDFSKLANLSVSSPWVTFPWPPKPRPPEQDVRQFIRGRQVLNGDRKTHSGSTPDYFLFFCK
jgi:hypothetical protein